MTVAILERSTGTFVMNEDGEFHCAHENAEVTPPCCDGQDCGCHGRASVWCYVCQNEDITQEQINDICEGAGY